MSAPTKRIVKELTEITQNPPAGCKVRLPDESNIYNWEILMDGPADSVYAGGHFKIALTLPHDYPFKPPSINFRTKIYHPNITNDDKGAMCLGMLRPDQWKPPNKLMAVIVLIQNLLSKPEPDDAVEQGIADAMKNRRAEFEKTAREWTGRYAGR
ncbi:UBC-like protein [Aulographum hederae CBS 113979]|uniref:E2 ubiquitin-conjugating enzyme n=1 Tax=Aulographum hederae CBS 113979 TaxID=1176131 RepID=A0A6G1H213_9PEZI|nr:UBC-like protein [Aulographum hederae CBS 113979]